jgi:hypothetical protein
MACQLPENKRYLKSNAWAIRKTLTTGTTASVLSAAVRAAGWSGIMFCHR